MLIHFQYFHRDKNPLKASFGLLFPYQSPKSHFLPSMFNFIFQNLPCFIFWVSVTVQNFEIPFLKLTFIGYYCKESKIVYMGFKVAQKYIEPI